MNLDKHRLTKNILVAAIMGASSVQVVVPPSLVYAANSVVANDKLPALPDGVNVNNPSEHVHIERPGNNVMNITQDQVNAVIKWKDFSIGANATVNFDSKAFNDAGEFNTLNYVNSGNLSQIYGTINADKGNIFIVNPAGVEIGNSAQINVGSLYVSNKNLTDDQLNSINQETDMTNFMRTNGTVNRNTELMSLGNINATNVTFDGDRIVLDVDRIRKPDEKPSFAEPYGKYDPTQLKIYTTDKDKVIVGYTDQNYTEKGGYSDTVQEITVNENDKVNAYKWVKDYDQLQAIGKDDNHSLDDNFALRNSIDANGETFKPIGDENKSFTGNFDGLGFNIYGLTIGSDTDKKDNTGLFGVVDGATIGNVNLISGTINGSENTGALIGKINDSGKYGITKVENILNTAQVTGSNNVGGIIGSVTGQSASKVQLSGLINTGAVSGKENVGGLVGSMENAELIGTSYNLADISGKDNSSNNIGGLVGSAKYATIGNDTAEAGEVYNHLDVTGGYNVGGIVGSMENSTVQNVSNDGNVTATGYTEDKYNYHTGETNENNLSSATLNGTLATLDVKAANVGGIAGNSVKGTFDTVVNEGDISSKYNEGDNTSGYYYEAGNVGGVVGRAEDTTITDATNKEANIRGAHNVGGIAGYFGNSEGVLDDTKYTIRNGINNGGDILATGARLHDSEDFAKEIIRPNANTSDETFIIGNIGGIAGYMYGDNTHITQSANRGTVHTAEITDSVKNSSKAANVGGIVGKIDRESTNTLDEIKEAIKNDEQYKQENNLDVYNENLISETAVSNSYNTGLVRGYTGVGGVVGMMYNGEVAGSHNLGTIQTTRTANSATIEPLNMGGVVGDTTENIAHSLIYDVYNKGQIGDETFTYYGRHVGGVVGRLSGDVEKAYNNGAIYNGSSVVGGIAGWWVNGNINNVFNTGNITVVNNNNNWRGSEVGGIVGGAEIYTTSLTNAYNLGTLRSFRIDSSSNSLGGIIGNVHQIGDGGNRTNDLNISNVYTLGNLYIGRKFSSLITGETFVDDTSTNVGSIYGKTDNNVSENNIKVTNGYYIAPSDDSGFSEVGRDNSNQKIAYGERLNLESYSYTDNSGYHKLGFDETSNKQGVNNETGNNKVSDENYDWRIYEDNTTPILNAFLPKTEEYFSTHTNNADNNISSIQYGTAYDPLLTIIKANGDVNFDWQKLGMSGDAGLAVYGGGLTLTNFANLGGTGFFGGTIYTDGNLNITNVQENVDTNTDIRFGSSSKIYGSSISISADGNFEGYGDIIATGNNNGTGDISLSGDNVDIYGKLQSAVEDEDTFISGVEDTAHKHDDIPSKDKAEDIKDPSKEMVAVEDRYKHKVTSDAIGDITITANNGDVNIYYGNEEKGIVDTDGSLTVSATSEEGGNIYIDSDLNVKGALTAISTSKDDDNDTNGEIVIDISNIGRVNSENHEDNPKAMHEFLNNFKNENDGFNFEGTDDYKITVDMWDDNTDSFKLNKYDTRENTLAGALEDVYVNGNKGAKEYTYIWVEDGNQLKGIQEYKNKNNDSNILDYNFVLKNDINATDIDDYKSIGGNGTGYTGTFDGRDNRIIGLNNDGDGESLFGIIGNGGSVENLKVYSSNFNTNGAIARTNNGIIDNVTGLGNHVTGTTGSVGGLVGINNGTISSSTDRSSVTTDEKNTIGGLAGENSGTITDSSSNSAVIGNNAENIGGVVGSNTGKIDNADSLGITNGASNVGGIVGSNEGNGAISNVYNESIVIGSGNNIGGVAGTNKVNENDDNKKGSLTNVANAGDIKATDTNAEYIGGIIGENNGTVDGGRNNARIEGNKYVGGIVGNNGENSDLHNITNDSSAFIVGEEYVGGIAGSNEGSITGDDIGTGEDKEEASLVNRGTITGQKYVGGVAGRNTGNMDNKGIITNVNSDMTLNVKDKDATGDNAPKYFGGVVGLNDKYGVIEDAINSANINAEKADYVGGIVGKNDGHLQGAGNSNKGNVIGNSNVGGVVGLNNAYIKGTNGTEQGMVGISNEGKVTAMQGGAGGIIGTNNADIEYAHLVNKGQVIGNYETGQDPGTGEYGTGGLIGILEKDKTIKHSDLINEKNGIVTGGKNVGGLIGINKGTVEGGRIEEDGKDVGYYKYQIYNNGAIVGENGENIGGLIGKNNGTLTAGYNTGAINITNGENVGGIVGNNEGTVDQVFNTVGGNVDKVDIMDKDDPTKVKKHYDVVEQISGATNVGGLIGTNSDSGTLSNAYNTSTVYGSTDAGNAIGNNTGKAENIYANNPTGNLIGNGTGTVTGSYSFSTSDNNKNGITYLEGEAQKDKDKYTSLTDENTWKFYDGSTNPLLKVFLTKAQFTPAEDKDGNNIKPNFVYNADTQGVLIRYNETTEKVEVLDAKNIVIGFIEVADEDAAHSLMDYINSINGTSDDKTPNDGKQLINGTQFIDAGTYEMLFSQQINTDGQQGNPNNLGYDFVTSLGISGTPDDNTPPTITNDKAQISIDLNDIERNYGNSTILNGNNYGHTVNWANSYNGEDFNDKMKGELKDTIIFNGMTDDGALSTAGGDKVTSDAGDYTWTGSVTFDTSKGTNEDHLKKNYEFVTVGKDQTIQDNTITAKGGSKVNKANLYINVNDEQILEGETPNYTGKVSGLVNGDTESILGSHQYGVENPDIEMQVGTYRGKIGIWFNGKFYTANKNNEVDLPNYKVIINPGTLTVTPIIHPEDDKRNWNNLLNDAPWDRNRDFRERKAEFNHVNGGITIEKNDEDIVVEA